MASVGFFFGNDMRLYTMWPRRALLSLFLLLASACATPRSSPPPTRVDFVLGEDGLAGYVEAPEQAQAELQGDSLTLRAGPGFAMTLTRGALDLQAEQRRVIDDRRLQLQEFVTHSPDTLIWRWGPTDAADRFHFAYTATIAGQAYHCRSLAGEPFSLEQVGRMLEACRSVRFGDPEAVEAADPL